MAWLDGWAKRVPVAVINTGPAAVVEVLIPIPDDWDDFWTTIDTAGNEMRITAADGVTVEDYNWAGSPGWSKANRTGSVEVYTLAASGTAGVALCWLYYGYSGANGATSSGTLSAPVDGYIHQGRPRGLTTQARPAQSGSTRPVARFQKTSDETTYIWLEVRGMLDGRISESGDSLLWEEVQYVTMEVTIAGATQAALFTQSGTRFIETPRGFFIGVKVKAGTSGTDYTVEPAITTWAPEITIDAGSLTGGSYRTLNPRAVLSVYDISEA